MNVCKISTKVSNLCQHIGKSGVSRGKFCQGGDCRVFAKRKVYNTTLTMSQWYNSKRRKHVGLLPYQADFIVILTHRAE